MLNPWAFWNFEAALRWEAQIEPMRLFGGGLSGQIEERHTIREGDAVTEGTAVAQSSQGHVTLSSESNKGV
jgi:hypothetical protein